MTDLAGRLRRATTSYYDQSYPLSVLTDPHIDTLTPNTVSAAGGAATITVTGTRFEPTSVIEIDQVAVPTTYVSATSLTTSFNPNTAGTVTFTVRNTSGEESNSVPFTVGALAADEEPSTQSAPDPEPGEVCAGTVEEVKAYVIAHPASASDIAAAEQGGKGRMTLLTWLDELRAGEAHPYEGAPMSDPNQPQPDQPQPDQPVVPNPDQPQPGVPGDES